MFWNGLVVLLSFAAFLNEVLSQLSDNTPPTIWLDNRDWILNENETVGSRVAQAHGDDAEGGPLQYGLEQIFYSQEKIPFRINPDTGTVFLNESLQGLAGKNLHFYVTVSDGEYSAKSEVNVNIQDPRSPVNPSKSITPPYFGKKSGVINFPGFFPRPPQSPSKVPNYQVLPPSDSPITKTVYPIVYPEPAKNNVPRYRNRQNQTTPLKLVPITIMKEVNNDISAVPQTTVTTPPTTKSTSTTVTEKEIENDLLSIGRPVRPVKSPTELTSTIIPILSVIVVFCTVGAVAVLFRKRIYLSKPKDSKKDMRKESTNEAELQSDVGLNMREWRISSAPSNRYEPWPSSCDYFHVGDQITNTVKNADRWEFPRHRLKFFNIIGEGAFGQVWKCEAYDIDGKDNAPSVVAVKTLKENANEKEKSDLISELQVMKMLEPHPNVVRLLGCCTDKEPIFLIMEYISKGKLQSYLRNSRAERYYNNMYSKSKYLTSRDLTSFVYQVAKGMDYLSSNRIIHRDLAARNVLITEEHTCKVADFGFARDVMASHVYERKSEGRLPIRWMAPESLYDNIFSVKSDVWSFGILIWEVVTLGSTPYPGMSAAEVMKKVKDGYRLDKPEHCRRELYNIMYYCWDKDPKQRPSFRECVELLEKLLLSETDYIELERFPDHSYYNMMSLSGEKL